jgi:Mor family transcriptional regulator
MYQSKAKPKTADPVVEAQTEEEVAYLSKRHRVSPAIVREIIRRIGSSERSAVEREIRKGMTRR